MSNQATFNQKEKPNMSLDASTCVKKPDSRETLNNINHNLLMSANIVSMIGRALTNIQVINDKQHLSTHEDLYAMGHILEDHSNKISDELNKLGILTGY